MIFIFDSVCKRGFERNEIGQCVGRYKGRGKAENKTDTWHFPMQNNCRTTSTPILKKTKQHRQLTSDISLSRTTSSVRCTVILSINKVCRFWLAIEECILSYNGILYNLLHNLYAVFLSKLLWAHKQGRWGTDFIIEFLERICYQHLLFSLAVHAEQCQYERYFDSFSRYLMVSYTYCIIRPIEVCKSHYFQQSICLMCIILFFTQT